MPSIIKALFSEEQNTTTRSYFRSSQKFSGHFTLAELTRKVQEQFPEMGEITIYRSLKVLIEKQILEEIDLPNERKKYEVKKGHHEHIFCQNCGNLIEFYNAEMEALQNKIAEEYGVTLLFIMSRW